MLSLCFPNLFYFLFTLHVCVFISVYHMCGGAQGSRELSDPLKLELQSTESFPTWVPGTESHSLKEQEVLSTVEPSLSGPQGFPSSLVSSAALKGFFCLFVF